VHEDQAQPYQVAIVVDPDFGLRLIELSQRMHVWVCESPVNQSAATQVRLLDPAVSIERGVTTFETAAGATPEEVCRDVLDTVELHHGEFSHKPRWGVLNVYGTQLTPDLEAALHALGVVSIHTEQHGFTALRPE